VDQPLARSPQTLGQHGGLAVGKIGPEMSRKDPPVSSILLVRSECGENMPSTFVAYGQMFPSRFAIQVLDTFSSFGGVIGRLSPAQMVESS
jgi:hypothetical protein